MAPRGAFAALTPMTHDDDPIPLVTERFERRLEEECGRLRRELFLATQTAAIAALFRLFR